MLIGEYTHALDLKGRVNFPAKLREELGDCFYITKGLDNCLFVYGEEEWAALAAQIKKMPYAQSKGLKHFFFGSAGSAEPDKQGRIVIPQSLREHAELDKEVVIVGAMDHAEIWDKQRWQDHIDSISSDSIEAIMDEINF